MSQEKMEQFSDNLTFIENIPKSSEILTIEIKSDLNSSSIINESDFLNALDYSAKSLNPEDKILWEWHYSPWCTICFYTSEGKYEVTLLLGGLGFITLPNRKKGAVLFDIGKK